jgi:hypothetical protein
MQSRRGQNLRATFESWNPESAWGFNDTNPLIKTTDACYTTCAGMNRLTRAPQEQSPLKKTMSNPGDEPAIGVSAIRVCPLCDTYSARTPLSEATKWDS